MLTRKLPPCSASVTLFLLFFCLRCLVLYLGSLRTMQNYMYTQKNKNGRSTSALWWGDEFTLSLAGVAAGFEVCASSQNASRSWASSSIWVLFVGYFVCTPACVWFAQANLVARRREMEMGRRGRRRLGVYAALPRETDDFFKFFFSFPSLLSFLQDGGKLSRPKPVLDVNTSSLAGKGNAAVWRSR